jgi:hypothetical protein
MHGGLSVEFGDWWGFYRDFWRAHNLEHVAQLLLVAEVAIPRGGALHVPLLIRNDTENPEGVSLTTVLPRDWTEKTGSARYPVRAHDIYPAQLMLIVPDVAGVHWQEITWNAEANGRLIGTLRLRVLSGVDNGGLPQ